MELNVDRNVREQLKGRQRQHCLKPAGIFHQHRKYPKHAQIKANLRPNEAYTNVFRLKVSFFECLGYLLYWSNNDL